jgi:citrate lyase subunit beta/citryl-CoA lyase
VDKAVNTEADVVIIDLEDAVAISRKQETRPKVREKLMEHRHRRVIVRVNSLDSQLLDDDLGAIAGEHLRCIIVPKVEDKSHIQEANSLLSAAEKERGIQPGTISVIPLIESARALENVLEIASEKTDRSRVLTVAFGAADYALDLGIELTKDASELFYARSRIPVACRAAGLEPPLDTPFMIDLKDPEALKADAAKAKQLGFQGKLCIHPNQIAICNAVFSPTAEEVLYAERVIEAFEDAEAKGVAAIQLDGQFIDYAVVDKARRILRLAASVSRQSG